MTRLVGLLLIALLAACTSSIKLQHPTPGQVAQCGPYHIAPNVGFGMSRAVERENRCLDDYQRQGFERVP
jgi:hypothetical protein